jgi:hypothetical protein
MEKKIFSPDPLATWEEKKKTEYGLSYAYLISKEWFNGGMITDNSQYGNRRDWIINKRLLVRGKQDTKKYKEHISRQDGDLTYLNLDWRPLNSLGKYCNLVSNGINDNNYNLDIRANDRLTVQRRKDQMAEHRNTMRSMPLLKKVKEQLGLDLIPKGFIPEDEEELRLYSEIKDRPKIEIAEEITINYIKNTNNYDYIEKRKNKDLVEIGISAGRTWTDPVEGIKLDYVDPEYLVHSHVNKNDFSDATYFGYIESVTLDDIKRESGMDDEDLRKIAKYYGAANKGNVIYETTDIRDLLSFKADVLRFTFKTSKTTVYKAKKRDGKTIKITTKDESYNPPERSDYGRLSSTRGTWMEGSFIVGTETVYNYKECEHIVRDEQNKPMSPFIVRATNIYKNELHSFLDDLEPVDDQIQYINLKTQHLIAELKPDLIVINEDALADLSGSGDKAKMWNETLNLLNVKGVVVEKAVDMGEMGVGTKQAARPASNQQGSALAALFNAWAKYEAEMRNVSGINPARDGSLPHDALLGINQMAQLASNTVTQHIVDSATEFNKRFCETISARVHNIFRSKDPNSNPLKKLYERAVGNQNIEALEVMKDRHLHDFGFTVNMVPTQKEIQEFKEDLALSLQDGSIDVEIKSEAQQIAKTSLKLASQYLFYMRKKRRKEMLEEEAKRVQMKSQGDMQAAQSAAQSQAQAYQFKKKADLQYEAQLAQIDVMKTQAIQQIEAPIKEQEFRQDVFLKQLETIGTFKKLEYQENRKDDRVDKQSTQQSKMIYQRKKEDASPIDFENGDIFGDIFNMN